MPVRAGWFAALILAGVTSCGLLFAQSSQPASPDAAVSAELDSGEVSFQQIDSRLEIRIDGQPVAEYVFDDDVVRRPYFRHLRTCSGVLVTRTHPPVKGTDIDDHPTMHPGLWLAFGDLSGEDFWRNKGRVRHVEFVRPPQGNSGSGAFSVRNQYETESGVVCREDCTIVISVRPGGYRIDWDSAFQSDRAEFSFGDQEEMGLGVRMATPLAADRGGTIVDSLGRTNGAEVWGKSSDWCRYGGVVGEEHVGVVLMPHPDNVRPSWFHARDYGLLVANPFGVNAFTQGEKSRVAVERGQTLRLKFGVLIYSVPIGKTPDVAAEYATYLRRKD